MSTQFFSKFIIFTVYKRGVKNTPFYPHFVDKGVGSVDVDKREGRGVRQCGYFFFIIKCQNRGRGRRGGQTICIRIFVCFRPF